MERVMHLARPDPIPRPHLPSRRDPMALKAGLLFGGAGLAVTGLFVATALGWITTKNGMWPPAALFGVLPGVLLLYLGYAGLYVWSTGRRPPSADRVNNFCRLLNSNIRLRRGDR